MINEEEVSPLLSDEHSTVSPSEENSKSMGTSDEVPIGTTPTSDDTTPNAHHNASQPNDEPTIVSRKNNDKGIGGVFKASQNNKQTSHQFSSDQPKQELEPEIDDSEHRPYQYLSIELLKIRYQLIEKEIKNLFNQVSELVDEIAEISGELAFVSYSDQRRKIQKELRRCKLDRSNYEEKCEELQKELTALKKELDRRAIEASESNISMQVQAKELYRQGKSVDDVITNVILYTGTFFAELPPNDFKEVVFEFLRGKVIKIQSPRLPKTKPENEEAAPTFNHIDLAQYWRDSLSQGNHFLEACYLKAKRENGMIKIDFSMPNLRENLSQYLQEEQPLFFDEQLERVETLLFHSSKRIADQATRLLAEAAIYQGVNWLLEIAGKASDDIYFFDRIANLIYEIQLRLKPTQSEVILIPFFKALLAVSPENAFDTIWRLLYRHLRSQSPFNILNAATQLLNWLREIIDNGDESEQVQAMNSLWRLFELNETSIYLYDLLELLYTWLPKSELAVPEYQESHKVALAIFFKYCQETTLGFAVDNYGKWPSEYAMFKSLAGDTAQNGKLNMLVSWLFYRSYQKDRQCFALEAIVLDEDPSEEETFELGLEIAFITLEWFVILCGLNTEKEAKPEAYKLAKVLIRQIFSVTDRSEQRQLVEWWTEWIERFLDMAEEYDQEGNASLRKQFVARRVRAKELKQIFKQLQNEAQLQETP
jgi:hypothetical protein